jgi:telomerase reverse transcriptase
MCTEIIRRHKQCDYERLLEKCCPLPFDKNKPVKWQSGHCPKKELSSLVTLFTPSDNVGQFLDAVLQTTLPNNFWGSKHNFCQVTKTLKVFTNLGLTETFPEKSVVAGIRVLDMKWLHPNTHKSKSLRGEKKPKLARSGHESAVILLRNVMHWIYTQFITPLLRSTFYITDTEFTGRRVVYYRRPVWARIRLLSLEALLTRQYRERSIEKAHKVLSTHHVGCPPAPLRLLPKKSGIRAIAMLSKFCAIDDRKVSVSEEATKTNNLQSILPPNKILQSTFHALKYEYKKQSTLFGAGVLGVTEVFPSYCLFVDALRKKFGWSTVANSNPKNEFKLYFTSGDIQKCYDTINQEHLYKQVRPVVKEDYYITQNHFILHSRHRGKSSTRCRWQKTTCSPDKFSDFLSMSKAFSDKYCKSIFVDGTNHSVEKRQHIVGLLKDHIFGQMVVANGSKDQLVLLQRNGIPQGSILSSLFCNAYFGNVEERMFDGVFEQGSTVIRGSSNASNLRTLLLEKENAIHLLVRIVDDYMLISTDKATSLRFLKKLDRGVPRLGVKVNRDKTRTNYDPPDDGIEVSNILAPSSTKNAAMFPWCGLLIDTKTCEIRLDHDRFSGSLATDSVTVHRLGKEGSALMKKMKDFVKPRCRQQLLFSSFLNSPDTIRVNFYQTFMLCAMKTMHYLKSGDIVKAVKNVNFVYKVALDTIQYAFILISSASRASPDGTATTALAYKLTLKEALWLGRHAFFSIMDKPFQKMFREKRDAPLGNRRDLLDASKRAMELLSSK